ncbi:hypothetical protein ABZ038_40005, partial [Streptomyces sp. NPDC006349]
NVGVASGAAVGGWALASFGVEDVPLTALVFAVLALPAVWATRFLKVPAARTPAAGAVPAAAGDTTPVPAGG